METNFDSEILSKYFEKIHDSTPLSPKVLLEKKILQDQMSQCLVNSKQFDFTKGSKVFEVDRNELNPSNETLDPVPLSPKALLEKKILQDQLSQGLVNSKQFDLTKATKVDEVDIKGLGPNETLNPVPFSPKTLLEKKILQDEMNLSLVNSKQLDFTKGTKTIGVDKKKKTGGQVVRSIHINRKKAAKPCPPEREADLSPKMMRKKCRVLLQKFREKEQVVSTRKPKIISSECRCQEVHVPKFPERESGPIGLRCPSPMTTTEDPKEKHQQKVICNLIRTALVQ